MKKYLLTAILGLIAFLPGFAQESTTQEANTQETLPLIPESSSLQASDVFQRNWGIGVGTDGLNLKTNPDKRFSLAYRQNIRGFVGSKFRALNYRGEISGLYRFVNKYNFKVYTGFGLGTTVQLSNISNDRFDSNQNLFIPIGTEFFPFQNKNFGLSFEKRLVFNNNDSEFRAAGGNNVLEFTHYFGRKNTTATKKSF